MAKQMNGQASMLNDEWDFGGNRIMAVYIKEDNRLVVDRRLDGGARKLIEAALLEKQEKGTLECSAIEDTHCIIFLKGKNN